MRALARRLEALEQTADPPHRTILLWKDYGETVEQVIDRYVAAHPEDADAENIVFGICSWQPPHDASADQQGEKGRP